MLGRVANGIFWMYRYLERAENTARLLAAGHRMALTRGADAATEEWRSVLTTLGLLQSYEAHYDDFAGAQVSDFVLRGKTNPESVLAMIERASFNARSCRSAITLEARCVKPISATRLPPCAGNPPSRAEPLTAR